MSYLLTAEKPVTLARAVEPGGRLVFQLAFWDSLIPRINHSTVFNLFNDRGDNLLHISLRPEYGTIVFNSRPVNGNWEREEVKQWQNSFVTRNFRITVCDQHDEYQILFNNQILHHFRKRRDDVITSVDHYTEYTAASTLSDTILLFTENGVDEVASSDYRARSDIRFMSNPIAKPTFSHGVGLIAVSGHKKKDCLAFEYSEYCFLGNAITLTLEEGNTVLAKDCPFKLPNNLNVTYGEISSLAGDFYGTNSPISDGTNKGEKHSRFLAAFNTLTAVGPHQPKGAKAILAVLQEAVDAANRALRNQEDPSAAYGKLPDKSARFEELTRTRPDILGHIGLAQTNWDHFGADARTSYNVGHGIALNEAVKGNLMDAYAMNAFADHFLEDSFSAGHLRTPRRELHSSTDLAADFCAKKMHEEDNAIGLSVQNPNGQKWWAYGGKRALDPANDDNKIRCLAAVQASADEIFYAWKNRKSPSASTYKAWAHAPTLESARSHQLLPPLFNFEGQRREAIMNRYNWDFTSMWTFTETAITCVNSGWWKNPITLSGPDGILSNSAVTAIAPSTQNCQVYFQDAQGGIRESIYSGVWTASNSVLFTAKLFSPLAVISWNQGQEIRIYYLSPNNILSEWCYSCSNGQSAWYSGYLSDLQVRTAPNTSIAAAVVQLDDDKPDINVYCQESTSNKIQEYRSGKPWKREATLPMACAGSSIAVARNRNYIRVYYQAPDLTLKEHCWDKRWYQGHFYAGEVPRKSTIFAFGPSSELCVFWQNSKRKFAGVKSKWRGDWVLADIVFGPLPDRTHLSAIIWESVENIRVYYQAENGDIVEEYIGSFGRVLSVVAVNS